MWEPGQSYGIPGPWLQADRLVRWKTSPINGLLQIYSPPPNLNLIKLRVHHRKHGVVVEKLAVAVPHGASLRAVWASRLLFSMVRSLKMWLFPDCCLVILLPPPQYIVSIRSLNIPGVEMDVWALLVCQYLGSSPGAGSQNSHSLEDSEQGGSLPLVPERCRSM